MEIIREIIRLSSPDISEKDLSLILEGVELKCYKKKDVILNVGEQAYDLYFIIKGVVRTYFKNGEKIYVKNFFTKNQFCSPMVSLHLKEPSLEGIDCLEDTQLFALNSESLRSKTMLSPEIALSIITTLDNAVLVRENRIRNLLTLDATERYLKLRIDIPNIDNLVAQFQIASYLNITPVQLSRIRKKLYSK